MTNQRGGKREGSGRKPKLITEWQKLTLSEKAKEADNSLNLLIQFRNDVELSETIRRDCANDVLDRVWGKPKQVNDHNVDLKGRLVLVFPEKEEDGNSKKL